MYRITPKSGNLELRVPGTKVLLPLYVRLRSSFDILPPRDEGTGTDPSSEAICNKNKTTGLVPPGTLPRVIPIALSNSGFLLVIVKQGYAILFGI